MDHLLDTFQDTISLQLSLYKNKVHICVCGFAWHRMLLIRYNYLIDSIILALLCSLSNDDYWLIPLSPCHFGNLSNHNVTSLAVCIYSILPVASSHQWSLPICLTNFRNNTYLATINEAYLSFLVSYLHCTTDHNFLTLWQLS